MLGQVSQRALLAAACAALAGAHAQAALVWTGADDGVSLYNEANWLDDNGAVPAANTINGSNNATGSPISAATGGVVDISGGTGFPGNFGPHFDIGAGNTLILAGGNTLGSSSTWGIRVDGGSALATNEQFIIAGGSTVNTQFLIDFDVDLDEGSTLQLRGGGNPLNDTTVDVSDTASTILFNNETYAAFNSEHASKVTFQGNALVFGSDAFVLEAGDNAVATQINNGLGIQLNFVPEPGSLALMGLGGLLIARRRRA